MKKLSSLISLIATLILGGCLLYNVILAQKWRDKALQYQQNGINYLEKCNEVTTMQLAGLQKLDSIINVRDAKLKVYEEAYGKILMPGESMEFNVRIDTTEMIEYKLRQ